MIHGMILIQQQEYGIELLAISETVEHDINLILVFF
jgi:hypothetical protein